MGTCSPVLRSLAGGLRCWLIRARARANDLQTVCSIMTCEGYEGKYALARPSFVFKKDIFSMQYRVDESVLDGRRVLDRGECETQSREHRGFEAKPLEAVFVRVTMFPYVVSWTFVEASCLG